MNLFRRPRVTPASPMPDENDPAVRRARQQQYQAARERSGRESTILSDSYSRERMGG